MIESDWQDLSRDKSRTLSHKNRLFSQNVNLLLEISYMRSQFCNSWISNSIMEVIRFMISVVDEASPFLAFSQSTSILQSF